MSLPQKRDRGGRELRTAAASPLLSTGAGSTLAIPDWSEWTGRMPKLIDYGVRFELMREAVLAIAAREGAQAVSAATVARHMRVSADTIRRSVASPAVLPHMGLELVARRRRVRRLMHGRGGQEAGSVEAALTRMQVELPLDDVRLEEARAWASLTWAIVGVPHHAALATPHDPTADEPQRGGERAKQLENPDHHDTDVDTRVVELLQEREAVIADHVHDLVATTNLPAEENEQEQQRLHALIDGLTARCVTGRLSPVDAGRVLAHHVDEMATRGAQHVA
jgi:hypothetical protein